MATAKPLTSNDKNKPAQIGNGQSNGTSGPSQTDEKHGRDGHAGNGQTNKRRRSRDKGKEGRSKGETKRHCTSGTENKTGSRKNNGARRNKTDDVPPQNEKAWQANKEGQTKLDSSQTQLVLAPQPPTNGCETSEKQEPVR